MHDTSSHSKKRNTLRSLGSENPQAVLFSFAIIGAGVLSCALHWGFVSFNAAAAGAVYMIGYIAIASVLARADSNEKGFPRERLGDNAYYLGFFFTLTALMSAFYQYAGIGETSVAGGNQDAPSVDKILQVVSKGGLALSTTIIGISIRAVFRQWESYEQHLGGYTGLSPSVVRRFNETLNESAGAIKSLTTSLRETAEALSRTNDQLQHIGQFSIEASESATKLKEFNTTSTKLSSDVVSIQHAVGKIGESAERLSKATKSLPTILPKISSDVELLSATLDKAGDRATQISNELAKSSAIGQRPRSLIELLASRLFGSSKP